MNPSDTMPAALLASGGRLLIGAEWRDAVSGKRFSTVNPATGESIAEISEGDAADIDLAVRAARAAFDGPWAKFSAAERGKVLWRLGDLMLKNLDDLARLETLDAGKPISETTRIDIPYAADCFHYYAGAATKIEGATIPVSGPFFNYTIREPIGVVGLIVPWNFPLLIASRKIAPALAAGNTVILKPASETPLTALRLGELALEAGLPPGVFNVVPGFGSTAGAALVSHPGVAGIAFTGSTATGQLLMQSGASTVKKLSLELGGKSANIVLDDADLAAVLPMGAMTCVHGGQGCAITTRLLLPRSRYDEGLAILKKAFENWNYGDPTDPANLQGPQVSKRQQQRVLGYLEKGRKEGARLLVGGGVPKHLPKGFYIEPTVFADVDPDSTIAQEEIFGPVLCVIPFEDDDDAVRIANNSVYGLSGAVSSKSEERALAVARRIRTGTISVNGGMWFNVDTPFGGYKQSGLGRENGEQGFEEYLETKVIGCSPSGA